MQTGKIITDRREELGWSRNLLAQKADVSHVMIGKYERGDTVPSLEVAKKIATALDVSLDYLAGDTNAAQLNARNRQRLEELELLEVDKKQTLYDLIDTYIRDAKARRAYAT